MLQSADTEETIKSDTSFKEIGDNRALELLHPHTYRSLVFFTVALKFNGIRFPNYRVAVKLRALQKTSNCKSKKT